MGDARGCRTGFDEAPAHTTPVAGPNSGGDSTPTIASTLLTYFTRPYTEVSVCAIVLDRKLIPSDKGDSEVDLVLDQTIFHSQGGGQPSDTGTISVDDEHVLAIVGASISKEDGVVHHKGRLQKGSIDSFDKGARVLLTVNQAERVRNSRVHSAGHLIDASVCSLGLKWTPAKGYHFPDAPYVTYKIELEGSEKVVGKEALQDRENKRAALRNQLESVCNELIERGGSVAFNVGGPSTTASGEMVEGEEPKIVAGEGSTTRADFRAVRVVTVAGTPCPCGGTHVGDVREIGAMKIKKLEYKKDVVRVCYELCS